MKITTFLCAALCVAFFALTPGCACSSDSSAQAGQQPPDNSQSSESNTENGGQYDTSDRTIVENDRCAFVVTSYDPDGTFGFTVRARCENRSDRTLMFSWDECSVNGWMIDPFWAEEVTAGNTSNAEIIFDRDELEKCGITSVEELEFELHIYDSNDWEADPVVSEDYTIYPTGLGPGRIDIPERISKEGEEVIIDNGQCSFIIESVDPEGLMGYTLTCYLENKTDDELMFCWGDVAVNGMMIDPFWAASVDDRKRAYAEIIFLESDLEDNEIQTVEKIEFRLRVYDSSDWDSDDMIADEVFVYTP